MLFCNPTLRMGPRSGHINLFLLEMIFLVYRKSAMCIITSVNSMLIMSHILKFVDSIELISCLFVYDYRNTNLPKSCIDIFTRYDEPKAISTTRQAATGILCKPRYSSTCLVLSLFTLTVSYHVINSPLK